MNEESAIVGEAVSGCRRLSEAEKAEWARRYLESNLSLRKFIVQHGLGYSYMAVWRWVNKSRARITGQSHAAEIGFTEIKLERPVEQVQWAAELSLPGGRVLRLSRDVPASMLEQLVRLC